MTKAEVENRLMNEIHYLPIEIIEEMLRWALVIKKLTKPESVIHSMPIEEKNNSAGEALKKFLKKYESDPIDIDTAIFDSYRKSVVERDFRWED
jgi:hypothetical protein